MRKKENRKEEKLGRGKEKKGKIGKRKANNMEREKMKN